MELKYLRKEKTRTTGVRLTEQEFAEVTEMAKKEEVPMTEFCGAIIRTYLAEQHEKKSPK